MMMKSPPALLFLFFAMATNGASAEESRGTAQEAQALVAGAIEFFDDVGADAAFAEMNSGASQFRDRDLYIFVVATDGTVVAQVADPGRVGMDARTLRDAADTAYGAMIVDHATPEGVWV
jgi:hypothetical protein